MLYLKYFFFVFLGWSYRWFVKPVFFLFDSESVHVCTIQAAKTLLAIKPLRNILKSLTRPHSSLTVNFLGLSFPSPIGLAAGFDKNAELGSDLAALGFGYAEIGTITPLPQAGNDKPRLFREPQKKAIVNRMGFNSDGVEIVHKHLEEKDNSSFCIGINIGKNKVTSNENALLDYKILFEKFKNEAAYFTVNISSPNTPGLRDLQNTEFLKSLAEIITSLGISVPVFIKLAPEIDEEKLKEIAGLCSGIGPFKGLVLTNTIATDRGGMSGAPLRERSLEVLKLARKYLPAECAVISVGGIFTAQDVVDRLRAGANSVQVYSALIYEGPFLAAKINTELALHGKK